MHFSTGQHAVGPEPHNHTTATQGHNHDDEVQRAFLGGNRTCILSDVNTSVSTSQAMMVTISSFIFIDGIPLRGWEKKTELE